MEADAAIGPMVEVRELPPRRQLYTVVSGLLLVMALAALDQNIVNTALPRIVADLGNPERLSWVVSGFLLTATVAMPLYGKLSDVLGRRPTLFAALAVFLVGSALCGVAQSMTELVACRALQGLGGGGLITLAMVIVGDIVPRRERPRFQGLFTAVFALCSVAGPLLGGALTQALSWRWVFYINLPVGALALGLVLAGLQPVALGRRPSIDYAGAALLTVATTSFLLLLSWGVGEADEQLAIVGLAAVALSATLAFLWQERRAAEPVISMRLFRNRIFTVAAGTNVVAGFAMITALVFLPLYLQVVLDETPLQAGLIIMPQVFGLLLAGLVGGRLITRAGRMKPFLVAGALLAALSLAALAVAVLYDARTAVFAGLMVFLGAGIGLLMPNSVTLVQNAVARAQLGEVTGAINFVRSLGFAIGVSLSGSLVSLRVTSLLGPAGAASAFRLKEVAGPGARVLADTTIDPTLVHTAYRAAIGSALGVSAGLMALGFLLICTLPRERLAEQVAGSP